MFLTDARRLILSCCLSTSTIGWGQGAIAQSHAPSLWEHNGSIVYLLADGASREFHYQDPRPGLLQAGARRGSLLFRGRSTNGHYYGTAVIFNSACEQFAYQVSGPILDNYERVVLTGQAPHVSADCRVTGYFTDHLEFRLVNADRTSPNRSTIPAAIPPPSSTTGRDNSLPSGNSISSDRIEVQLNSDSGVLTVPVEINGKITLDFVLDSGASDVVVPADVVSTLIRTKTIRPSDFIGQQTYVLADGTEAPSAVFDHTIFEDWGSCGRKR